MRVFVLSYAIALLLSFSSTVSALTNAQRLARGLPISPPPKFGRAQPGFAWTPTVAGDRRDASASPSPSPSPSIKMYTGRILVSYSSQPLGYLYNDASGVNGLNLGPSSDLYVSFAKSGSPTDLQVTNPAFPAPYYIGTTSSETLGSGLPSAVGFGNVIKTPVYSTAVSVKSEAHESAIWTYDATTAELKAYYVNPDGSVPNTTIGYNTLHNSVVFVGDIDAYNAAQTDPDEELSPVTFTLDI